MSSQPDYSFHQPTPTESTDSSLSLHLPFALLATAIAIVMIAQTWNVFKQRSSLHDAEAQLNGFYRDREKLVQDSSNVQQKLQNLAMDLLLLSKTDPDAQAIIGKYNIQQTGNSAAPAAAAPDPGK
jgi:cell division protein FtsL